VAPTWLTVVAWAYLGLCFACAAVVTADIFLVGRRQMAIMNAVFPITASRCRCDRPSTVTVRPPCPSTVDALP
jgi:hypothetical protein